MKVLDVSVPVRPGMIVYEGDPEVRLERVLAIAAGELANVSRLDCGVHTGTHVDAPVHFADGAPGVEALPLDALVGPAFLVDATFVERDVDAEAIERLELPEGAERVLLKTRNSRLWELGEFTHDFVRLVGSGAQALVEGGVRLIGIDYLSIGDEDAHRILLGAGVVPIEGLDLRRVELGEYLLVAAPLKLVGSDGAPARVFLLRS
jgi:arylformamidase